MKISGSDNEKALFRRGKAHIGAWNPSEARSDLEKCVKLDPKLEKEVNQELARLEEMVRQKNLEDRKKLAGKMFNWKLKEGFSAIEGSRCITTAGGFLKQNFKQFKTEIRSKISYGPFMDLDLIVAW